jgi:hypothetical protein
MIIGIVAQTMLMTMTIQQSQRVLMERPWEERALHRGSSQAAGCANKQTRPAAAPQVPQRAGQEAGRLLLSFLFFLICLKSNFTF